MGVSLTFENTAKAMQALSTLAASNVKIQVVLKGPHAVASAVWEWGKADVNPGPKTAWSSFGPSGEMRVLTLTAPYGWIRINRREYIRIIQEELQRVRWARVSFELWPSKAEAALKRAADRCKELMANTAPVDTGELREEIREAIEVLTV